MEKNVLKTMVCLFAIAAAVTDNIAMAQRAKGLTRSIIINNGDTTVNGKKFAELNKAERNKLRGEFKEMEKSFRGNKGSDKEEFFIRPGDVNRSGDIVISRNGKEPNVLFWNDDISKDVKFNFEGNMLEADGDSSMSFRFNTDSLMKEFNFRMDDLDSNLRKRIITMHRDLMPEMPTLGRMERRPVPQAYNFDRMTYPSFNERNNSSSFNYNYTDKDGVSSRMNIRLSDAGKEQLKKITGVETTAKTLGVSDLTIFPNFSSGKMTLSFNISSKGNVKVAVLDSDLRQIFTDEAISSSGNYVKQLSLPQNGVYYVTVNQNGDWFVKRLVKE